MLEPAPSTIINLLGLDHAGLTALFLSLGEKSYRADQALKAIHFQGVQSIEAITTFSKTLRTRLAAIATIQPPEIAFQHQSSDATQKWVIRLADGNCIETVFIPEKTRGTLCISSQVGCTLNCSFCATGKQGFNRNLTTAEIIGQVWLAVRQLSQQNGLHDHAITNVVLMGMGEPLYNFEAVVSAIRIMLHDFAYGLSKRRVTLSTSGVVPAIYRLREQTDVALAISLHAPTDALRNQLVPLNKKYPLKMLLTACQDYFKNDPRRYVTMEYVMLANVNDSDNDAKDLIHLLKNQRVKVNLIPFNPFPFTQYQRSDQTRIDRFRELLMQAGINCITRKTRGEQIDAACGQLAGEVKDRTPRQARWKASLKNEKINI